LKKIVRAGGNAVSFEEAETWLLDLADLSLSSREIERLSERVGREMKGRRDEEVVRWADRKEIADPLVSVPKVAAIGYDGGRVRTRQEGSKPGVHEPEWKEVKVACVQSLDSKESPSDPQPKIPAMFLNKAKVEALCKELSRGRSAGSEEPSQAAGKRKAAPGDGQGVDEGRRERKKAKEKPPPVRGIERDRDDEEARRQAAARRPRVLVQACVASMAATIAPFGKIVAAEVARRRLDQAPRRAFLGDGDHKNWMMHAEYFIDWIPILDFIHLVEHLFEAARAARGRTPEAFDLYSALVTDTWRGDAPSVLAALRREAAGLGAPPEHAADDDPRKIVANAVGYVEANAPRMKYAEYRRQGLPITTCHVESLIKKVNFRIKASDKFWTLSGGDAVLQVRAARLSNDDRELRFWRERPMFLARHKRPYRKAA